MNGITHFLVGILIVIAVWHFLSDDWAEKRAWAMRTVFTIRSHPVTMVSLLRVTITCTLAFFSHAIIDGFAIFTYHPYKDQDILFNLIWSPSILIAAGIVAVIALRRDFRYAWGIVFSIAFDLWDYSVLRVIMTYSDVDLSHLYLHQFEWAFIAAFLFWAPNFYQVPQAALIEITIIAIFLMLWYVLEKRSPLPEKKPFQPRPIPFTIICVLFGLWLALPYII